MNNKPSKLGIIVLTLVCISLKSSPSGAMKNKVLSVEKPRLSGERVLTFGVDEKTHSSIFSSIRSICVLNSKLYVVDPILNKVFVFNSLSGAYIGNFAEQELCAPYFIGTDERDSVYIYDKAKKALIVINEKGGVQTKIASPFPPVSINYIPTCGLLINLLKSENGSTFVLCPEKESTRKHFFQKESPKFNVKSIEAGFSGRSHVNRNGDWVLAIHFPYELQIYDSNGSEIRKFSRYHPKIKPPYLGNNGKTRSGGGPIGVSFLNIDTIACIFFWQETEFTPFEYELDIFNTKGDLLGSLNLKEIRLSRVQSFCSDRDGYLYVVSYSPLPIIEKIKICLD